ncbi:MAG TPA: CdaR family protein [Pseudomonadota bacterium]|jgi:hypothetical protein|nr:CdaR family protein [Pseudomonadota bacterium]
MRDFLYRVFVEDLLLKAFALVIAIGLAIFVRTELEQSVTLYAHVNYVEPRGRIMVSEQRLDQVRVTVRGPWARISRLEDTALAPINLDMSNLRDGEFRFSPEQLRLPPGLRVENINPAGIYLHFEPEATVALGINLTIEGEPPEGYRFKQATPSPRVVRLRGAQNVLESMHNVLSRPLSVNNIRDTVTVPVELAPLPKHVWLADQAPPKLTATIVVELMERRYSSVPILPSGQPQNVRLQPTVATVVLRGQGVGRFLDVPQLVLDTVQEERKPVGSVFRKRLQVVNLPPGIAAEIQPSEVEFTVLRSEPEKPQRGK